MVNSFNALVYWSYTLKCRNIILLVIIKFNFNSFNYRFALLILNTLIRSTHHILKKFISICWCNWHTSTFECIPTVCELFGKVKLCLWFWTFAVIIYQGIYIIFQCCLSLNVIIKIWWRNSILIVLFIRI
jgi:hypothetical protein